MGKRKTGADKAAAAQKAALSQLESEVMDVLWSLARATAEDIRLQLGKSQAQLKDSTVRTILRRLEEKGYAEHDVDGRTFVYRPKVASANVATEAVRGIIERFCDGSVENLLVGLVDNEVLSPAKLQRLADKISQAEAKEKRTPGRKP